MTWTNTTDVPHTVTADSGATFDSGQVADGKTFSMTFKSAGTIAYRCTIHPYMTGTIVVLAAGASLPPTDTAAVATSSGPGAPAGVPWILVVIGAAGLATVGVGVRRYANTGASRPR